MDPSEKENLSNEYMQKKILHTNRKHRVMVHSKIKLIHSKKILHGNRKQYAHITKYIWRGL